MTTVEPPVDEVRVRRPEVEQAEFELRMRKFVLELMEPTINKSYAMETDAKEMRDGMRVITKKISELTLVSMRAEQQVQSVDIFRAELSRWGAEKQANETQLSEDIATLKQEIQGVRYSSDRKESSVDSLSRSLDRIQDEMKSTNATLMELQGNQTSTQIASSQMTQRLQTDFEVKFLGLETKLVQLGDDLWGGETGLAKLQAEMSCLQEAIEACQCDIKNVAIEKANCEALLALQTDMFGALQDTQSSLTSLQESVGNVVSDVKEHFRTASNAMIVHNAQLLSDARSKFRQDQANSSHFRDEVQESITQFQAQLESFEKTRVTSYASTEAVVETLRQHIEILDKKRKCEKERAETEWNDVKKQLGEVVNTTQTSNGVAEKVIKLLHMQMEAGQITDELDIQDDIDRQGVALLGFKEDGKRDKKSVISVDSRCLSCSGQSPHVLAGFKMACLQYRPSPVEYKSRSWGRSELLEQRRNILNKAYEQFQGVALTKESPNVDDRARISGLHTDENSRKSRPSPRIRPSSARTSEMRSSSRPQSEVLSYCGLVDIERKRPHTREGFVRSRAGRAVTSIRY